MHQFTHELTKHEAGLYTLTITTDCYSEVTFDHKIRFLMDIRKCGNRCWRVSTPHHVSKTTLGIDPASGFFYTLKGAVEFYLQQVDHLINFNLYPLTNYTFAQNSGGFFTLSGKGTIPGKAIDLDIYCAWNPYSNDKLWDGQIRVVGRTLTAREARYSITGELAKLASNFNVFGR